MDRELIRNVRLLSICRFMLYAQLVDEIAAKYYVNIIYTHYRLHSLKVNCDVYIFLIWIYHDKLLYSMAFYSMAFYSRHWIFNKSQIDLESLYFLPLL